VANCEIHELNGMVSPNAAMQALTDGGSLDERQWEVLDEICDVADAAASATFRRLWRR
jgi:hypothetical protein